MNRRDFLARLLGGAAAVAAMPEALFAESNFDLVPLTLINRQNCVLITPTWVTREMLSVMQNSLTFTSQITRNLS